ncbi:MAG: hypothetical protein KatS3mg105_0906 [Gemmatales bacterium]|nr:MAG: hypothetical protein KatS3mg105_0906 [Gemmatales bacterium]
MYEAGGRGRRSGFWPGRPLASQTDEEGSVRQGSLYARITALASLIGIGMVGLAQEPGYQPLPVGEPDKAGPALPSAPKWGKPAKTPAIEPPPPPPVRRQDDTGSLAPLVPIPDDGLGPEPVRPQFGSRIPPLPSPSQPLPSWGPPSRSTKPLTGPQESYQPKPQPLPAYRATPQGNMPATGLPERDRPAISNSLPQPLPNVPDARPLSGTRPAQGQLLSKKTFSPSVAAHSPGVFVEILGPEKIDQGMPLRYEIVARNTTSVPVFNVQINNEGPVGSRLLRADPQPVIENNRLIWNLGTLPPGTERRVLVEAQPGGAQELMTRATVTYTAAAEWRGHVSQPKLVLRKTGPKAAQVGDDVVFQLQVKNIGDGTAHGVVLHDHLPAGLRHESGSDIDADLGNLQPGEAKDVTLRVKAVSGGKHVNVARVTAKNASPADAQATVDVTEPALLVRKSGPKLRFRDREAEFDIEISNPGTATARNVIVTDQLPDGFEFQSASDSGVFDPQTGSVRWSLGDLLPGDRRGLRINVICRKIGEFVNRVVAKAERGLQSQAETPLRVEGVPALMLEVVDLDDPIEIGAETVYEIRILNQGTTTTTGLQIIATVPAGMEVTGVQGPTPYRIQGQQLVFQPLAGLATRADALYRVRVLCRRPGDWRFRVQLNTEQLQIPVYEEESTRVYEDLSTRKAKESLPGRRRNRR